jgi:hypothetical protein
MRSTCLLVSVLIVALNSITYAQAELEISLDKNVYSNTELMQVELTIRCLNSLEGCIFDNKIFERMASDIYYHLYKLDELEVNKGYMSSGSHPMGSSYFFMPASCSLVCRKTINLKAFSLRFPNGEYELRYTMPAYHPPKKVDNRFLKQYKILPYADPIIGSVKFKIKNEE